MTKKSFTLSANDVRRLTSLVKTKQLANWQIANEMNLTLSQVQALILKHKLNGLRSRGRGGIARRKRDGKGKLQVKTDA